MTDETTENKVLNTLVALLKLVRVRNCLIAFFGVLVGALLVTERGEGLSANVYVAALTAAIITGGGNALNDYYDSFIDMINRPTRSIPSGKIQRNDALMLAIILLLAGLALAKTVNVYCLTLAAINAIILAAYAAYSKKMLFIANLGVSYLVASVFIFGALSTFDSTNTTLDSNRIQVAFVITACAFFMTLSREIIKDVEDVEGDRKMHSKTLPIAYGEKKSKDVAVIFASFAILLSITPIALNFQTLNLKAYGILIAAADLTFIISLTMSPALSQKIMILGMTLSLAAFYLGKTLL
jgi:geranylgeranylglycerol-phosphate geranylgeranyltransferase